MDLDTPWGITLYVSPLYTQAELDAAVSAEREKWDVNDDNRIGLEEAIRALQISSGLRP